MFVLELTYTAPLDAVDALLEAHVAWLNEQFDKGVFLAAGRKVPRDGGIILALVEDRARAEEITARRPVLDRRRVHVPHHRVRGDPDGPGAGAVPRDVRLNRAAQPFFAFSARCSWSLFMFERPSMPRCLASLYSWSRVGPWEP